MTKDYCKICKEYTEFLDTEDWRTLCSRCSCYFGSKKKMKFVANRFGFYLIPVNSEDITKKENI